jgi:linoleoyl-CoA desaturase
MAEKIKFTSTNKSDFHTEIKSRVNFYFKTKGISPRANAAMVAKTIILLSVYSLTYCIILFAETSWLYKIPAFFLMGLSVAGIGFSVMHDAAHGAYSDKDWVNNLLGYTLNIIGGNLFTWKIQHNILHHTYTNLYEYDEDLDAGIVVRLSPYSKHRTFHKFQHIYAWFAYSLVHLSWVLIKDFKKISHYNGSGLTYQNKAKPISEVGIIVASKLFYLFYMVFIPLKFSNLLWWQFLLGFLVMSFTSGVVLSVVFQLAHVVEGTSHPQPNNQGIVENNWAKHQVETTANFSMNNPFISWYVGGLNFQIEHHLFPKICSVHYPEISKIVQKTAQEYGINYIAQPSITGAIRSHYTILKTLGNPA